MGVGSSNWITVAGIVFGIIAVFITVGVGVLSMNPPRYLIAKISFSFAAAILLVSIGLAFEQSEWSTQRVILAFVIFGVIGSGWLFSMKWIRNIEHKILTPLVIDVTLIAKVPFNLGHGALIPDYRPQENMGLFYSRLSFFSKVAFTPMSKVLPNITIQSRTNKPLKETPVLPETEKPINHNEAANFLAELSQYAIFSLIDELQHTKIQWEPSSRIPIVPPESTTIYPRETKFNEELGKNRFSRIGQEPERWGEFSDFKAPKDTIIKFTKHEGISLLAPTYVVELANPSLYSLKISIYVSGTHSSTNLTDYLLMGFNVSPEILPTTKIYDLSINCHFEFYRRIDTDSFQQHEYEKWALALFSGLQDMVRITDKQ